MESFFAREENLGIIGVLHHMCLMGEEGEVVVGETLDDE